MFFKPVTFLVDSHWIEKGTGSKLRLPLDQEIQANYSSRPNLEVESQGVKGTGFKVRPPDLVTEIGEKTKNFSACPEKRVAPDTVKEKRFNQ